jgi:hypothetical protein
MFVCVMTGAASPLGSFLSESPSYPALVAARACAIRSTHPTRRWCESRPSSFTGTNELLINRGGGGKIVISE